jgi:O-antigen/teichoic acid export membrane protein
MLPVYTAVLSPSDYGELSVALSISALAIVLFSLGLEIPVFRNVHRLEDQPQKLARFIYSAWSFLLVVPAVGAVLCSSVAAPFLGGGIVTPERLLLSLLGAAAFVSATAVPLATLRAQRQLRKYVQINLISTIASTSLVFVFVIVLNAGVSGWLAGTLLGNLIALGVAMLIVPFVRPTPFDWVGVKEALRLSLPVVPHLSAMLALQLADRVLVAALLSSAAAGIYSLASNMAMPMMLGVLGFGQAFQSAYARAREGDAESYRRLESTIEAQVAMVALFTLVCALLAPVAVHLIAAPEFSSAAPLTAWIVLGFGLWGLYQIPMNGVTLTHGRTKGLFVISGVGAVTNIGLIVLLAPRYGLEPVAIASAVGYASLLATVLIFAKARQATLSYPWNRIISILVLTGIGYAAAQATTGDSEVLDGIARVGWAAATAAGLAMLTGVAGGVRSWKVRLP